MPVFETLTYHEDHGLVTLTLNRPQARNALDLVMRRELESAADHIARDSAVRALVLTGAGGHFCSGGDVSSMRASTSKLSAEEGRDRVGPAVAFARKLLELQKPVIAAVDGIAYGAGFSIALCADVVVATPRARFCFPFLRVGLVPDMFTLYCLPRIVGAQRAKQLIYSASEIDGAQALAQGIVAELASPEALAGRCEAIGRAMTDLPRTAFGMTKSALLRSFNTDLVATAEAEGVMQGVAFNTDYHREAVGLLLEKKPLRYNFPKAAG